MTLQATTEYVTGIYFAVGEERPLFTEVVLERGHPFVSAYIVTPSLSYNLAFYGAITNPYRYAIYTASQDDSLQPINRCIANATEHVETFPPWKGDILVLKTIASDGEIIDAEPDDVYECEEYLLEAIAREIIGMSQAIHGIHLNTVTDLL